MAFLGQKAIYRRRGRPGQVPPVAPPQAASRGRPQADLWSSDSFFRIKNLRKLSSNSENISRSNFSEIENNKNRELALGILLIG